MKLDTNTDKEVKKSDIFGLAIPQLIHDIRNPLNIVIGFSSMLQLDKSINDETKGFINKVLHSGMQIEELLSNIDYYLLDRLEFDDVELSFKDEVDVFVRENNEHILEKNIYYLNNIPGDLNIVISREILHKILDNLFRFTLKGFKYAKKKQIMISAKRNNDSIDIIYSDTSEPVYIENKYFTFSEVKKSKRSLAPVFLEKLIGMYNGQICYLTGSNWLDYIKDYEIHGKTLHGFTMGIPNV